MNKYVRWAIRLIGPALLVLFLWRSDFSQLAAGFSRIQIVPLLLSLLLFFPFVAIKAWRWNALMAELGMHPPTLRFSMALYMIGLYLGGTTPGQSGDFIKAWYLRERGEALAPALFSIVLDRLFDFLIMALLALLALVAFLDILPKSAQIATIGFALAVFLATPALMARGPRERIFQLLTPLLPGRARAIAERVRGQLGALSMRPALLGLLLIASALSATSTMVRIWLLYPALGLDNIPLVEIIGSTALIAILQALPISFAGIGVRDAVLVALLGRHGHPPAAGPEAGIERGGRAGRRDGDLRMAILRAGRHGSQPARVARVGRERGRQRRDGLLHRHAERQRDQADDRRRRARRCAAALGRAAPRDGGRPARHADHQRRPARDRLRGAAGPAIHLQRGPERAGAAEGGRLAPAGRHGDAAGAGRHAVAGARPTNREA